MNRKLSTFRHDVNNHLMLIMASAELIQLNPQQAGNLIRNLIDQPQKISDELKQFSAEFEQTFGITRP